MASYLDHLNRHPVTVEPGQPVEIVPFAPRYAEAFARCYHLVYRDTFPMRYVYEPDQVVAAVANGDLISVLAATPKGEVVALTSAFHFGPNRRAWEIGGTMVIQAYRKGGLARRLNELVWKECVSQSSDAVYGSAVCNHTCTQEIGGTFGFRPAALDLDAFTNFEGERAIETSLLYLFNVMNRGARTVHLPGRYAAIAGELYDGMQIGRTIIDDHRVPDRADSVTQVLALADSLRVTFSVVGRDGPEKVAAAIAGNPRWRSIRVCLPAEQPATPWAAERLRESGFFLGGVLPLWGESDHLALQRTVRPPDWDRIALSDGTAQRLLAFIRADHDRLSSGSPQAGPASAS